MENDTHAPPSVPDPASHTAESPSSAPAPAAQEPGDLQGRVVEVLKTCFDPEIPVNIYELGLIYSIQVDPPGVVGVRMTLTSPACPVAGSLPPRSRRRYAVWRASPTRRSRSSGSRPGARR